MLLKSGPFKTCLLLKGPRLDELTGKPAGGVDSACEWPCLDLLESLARQQAQELKPISTAQVVETLRYTANKKGGPDGCTFRFLKLLPLEAYSGLVYILHLVEARLRWPEQFLLVQVACLPRTWSVKGRSI